jgi:hypothetical protein
MGRKLAITTNKFNADKIDVEKLIIISPNTIRQILIIIIIIIIN